MDPAAGRERLTLSKIKASRSVPSMAEDVRRGLQLSPKTLHPKYFYDERGSILFDQICDTPEYYPTRIESELIETHGAEILAAAQPVNILELGSGASRKSRLLLNAWSQPAEATYLPFDFSEEMLREESSALATEYPTLNIHGMVGDYTAGLDGLPSVPGTTLWMFIGSTLGNFEPAEAQAFVAEIAQQMQPGDSLLLGTDLHKSEDILEPAYNDAQGLTAAFNLNVLNALNNALDANFDLAAFSHLAYYCEGRRRIEMHLVSEADQTVHIGDLDLNIEFAAEERMRTEISRKFLTAEIDDMLAQAGLTPTRSMVHSSFPYALTLARKD